MSDTIDISVYPIVETVTFEVTENLTTININQVTSTGAVTSVNGLTGAVTLAIPDATSQLTNDSGFITDADLPDVSGLVPYTGATDNLDLGANRLESSQIVIKTLGDAKKMTLSSTNVSSERIAEWQDKDYTGIADITDIPDATSQLTNDSGFVTDISGKVDKNADITGETKTKITYDSKGLVTSGADLEASDLPTGIDSIKISTGNVSNTEFNYLDGVTSAIQTQLNAKLSGYLNKISTPVNVTGTTSETQAIRIEIPANTLSATDILNFHLNITKSGTAGNCTWKVKLSTSGTMPSGTTGQIATGAFNSTTLYAGYERENLPIYGGNIYSFPNTTTTGNSDIVSSSSAISSQAFDVTVTNYLYVSLTNGSSADTSTLRAFKLSNL